jgi:hypothetical protein
MTLNDLPMKQSTRILLALTAFAGLLTAAPARAEDVTSAQRRAALEYLNAAASGSAQAIAFAVHPDELDRLRTTLVARLREEQRAGGEASIRARLFGPATTLQDVERMTSLNFFQNLARGRLSLGGRRPYAEVKGLTAVRDGKTLVHVLVKGVQPEERGQAQIVEVVSLLPYGKDWKAAIPGDIEAQVEDLVAGRGPAAARAAAMNAGGGNGGGAGAAGSGTGAGAANGATAGAGAGAAGGAGAASGAGAGAAGAAGAGAATTAGAAAGAGTANGGPPRSSPEILQMLANAEKALLDDRCDDYYREYLSPTFRQTLSSKALGTLISGCRNGIAQREVLIAALRIVRRLPPRYEYGGNRAVYDVAGQGLPYDQFTVERVEGRWYIAE